MTSRIGQLTRQFLFRTDSAGIAVPPMDGPFTPNEDLDRAEALARVTLPCDIAFVGDDLCLAVGTEVWVVREDRTTSVLTDLGGRVCALDSDGTSLFAAVAGQGIVSLDVGSARTETVLPLESACMTALAVSPGTLVVAEGSAEYEPDRWMFDLMGKGSTGSVRVFDRATRHGHTVASGIRYCSGVALTPDEQRIVYSEAWAHRLMVVDRDGDSSPAPVVENLPVYPGRISGAPGGYRLSAFAVRTHLVEFVLTQDAYRQRMVSEIPAEYWIRPYLTPSTSGLDPLQGGQLKKLGVTKPWAPARSYGLVVGLDERFRPVWSSHSRPGGRLHGIVQAVEHAGWLYLASVGAGAVVRVHLGGPERGGRP